MCPLSRRTERAIRPGGGRGEGGVRGPKRIEGHSPRQPFHVEVMAAIEEDGTLLRGPGQVTQGERGGDGRGEGGPTADFAVATAAQHAPGRRRRRTLGRDEGEECREERGDDDEVWQHCGLCGVWRGCSVCGGGWRG